jgi:rhomboid protease GluP
VKREPDNNDDLEEALRRMREEFGPRRPREGAEDDPPLAIGPGPGRLALYGEAEPQPPPSGMVRLRLPTTRPRAIWLLLVVNVLMFLVAQGLSMIVTPAECFPVLDSYACALQRLGWKQNDLIRQGEYWRLLTAMFLHGNLVHIFFNGYALFVLGPETERIFSTPRFLALYFLSGLAGSLASYQFSPQPSVGASGAIFGLIGALATFYYLSRATFGEFGRRQLQSMAAVIIINLLIGFAGGGVIDNFAHMGGLAGGAFAGWLLAPRFTVDERLYPPVLVREYLPAGWPAAVAMLILEAALAVLIRPPL